MGRKFLLVCVLWKTDLHRAMDSEGNCTLNGGLHSKTVEGKIRSRTRE
jgi:hypothetical protein